MTSMITWVEPAPPARTVSTADAVTAETVDTGNVVPLANQLRFELPGHGTPALNSDRNPLLVVPVMVTLTVAADEFAGTAEVGTPPTRPLDRSMFRCEPPAS